LTQVRENSRNWESIQALSYPSTEEVLTEIFLAGGATLDSEDIGW
jgi:hypothetical protein